MIQLSVFDTVLSQKPDGTIAPGIAKSWRYNTDRTQLTLDIRDGGKFSNGEVVDAAAVAKSLEGTRKGPTTSTDFPTVTSIKAPDQHTVVMTLSTPDAALVPRLSGIDGAVAAPTTIGAPQAATKPVGSGPYLLNLEKSQTGSKYVLDKNKGYWDSKDYPFDTIEFSIISDPTAAFNGLRSGQLDFAQITADQAKQLPTSQFVTGVDNPTTMGTIWIADREGKVQPALRDVRVRQAINMAFDRKSIEKISPGSLAGLDQVFNPRGGAYIKGLEGRYPYDVQRARQLMAAAGYANGFTVTMPSNVATQPMEPVITQSLADIGIKVTWEPVALSEIVTKLLSKQYPMFYFPDLWTSDPQDAQPIMNGAFNPFGVMPAELKSLLSAANASDKPDAFAPVNRYLIENAWNAPLKYDTFHWAHKKSITYTPPATYRDAVAPSVWGKA